MSHMLLLPTRNHPLINNFDRDSIMFLFCRRDYLNLIPTNLFIINSYSYHRMISMIYDLNPNYHSIPNMFRTPTHPFFLMRYFFRLCVCSWKFYNFFII